MREYEIFIEGKFVPARSGAVDTTVNAFDGTPVAWVPRASDRDARRAIEAARRAADAQGLWRDLAYAMRVARLASVLDLLWERQAEIADLEVAEGGIPIRQASELVSGAISFARTINKEQTRPHGVVSLIVAADAPFARALFAIAGATLSGNAVVVKAPDHAPSSTLEIARAFAETDVPAGVVNIVPGGGRDAEREMAANALVDAVWFAGPKERARAVAEAAAARLCPATIEVFGAGISIILDDADLDIAIPGTLWGAFVLNGLASRRCARVFVPSSIAEPVAHHLARGAMSLRAGDPTSFETDVGPVARGSKPLADALARALDSGAVLLAGGNSLGAAHEPTVLLAPRPITISSIPGPWLAVVPFGSDEDAISLANAVHAGAAGVWSREGAEVAVRRLDAATVWANGWLPPMKQDEGYTIELGVLPHGRGNIAGSPRDGYHLLGLDRSFPL